MFGCGFGHNNSSAVAMATASLAVGGGETKF
jgi:hypothetical protein